MSLLVTGSIGIDTVESPSGKVVDALGGSSIYFAYSASFFTPVRLVGVVGDDCPPDFLKPLRDNPRIDTTGLEVRRGSRTFRWHGRYHEDVNNRDTVSVELNVLAERGPTIPERFRDSEFVFLGNTHPALQLALLGQLQAARMVAADTMDLWIKTEQKPLLELLTRIDGLLLNDSEAKLLTGRQNTVAAGLEVAKSIQTAVAAGRRPIHGGFAIVKKGEHGSVLISGEQVVAMPAYPATKVVDPTGAGDSFAGAFMGFLAECGSVSPQALRRAMAYGTVTASFTLEDFSLGRLLTITRADIDRRLSEYEAMLRM